MKTGLFTYFIIFFCLGFSHHLSAQTDSLYAAVQKSKGKEKVNLLIEYSRATPDIKKKQAILKNAIYYAKENKLYESQADAIYTQALLYSQIENYSAAYETYTIGLKLSESVGYELGKARFLMGLGDIYSNWGNYKESLEHLFEALRIFEALNDSMAMATTYNIIGAVYDNLQEYEKELAYFNKALAIYQKQKYERGIAMMYNNIGLYYDSKKDYDQALDYHQKSKKISEKRKDTAALASSYNNMGDIYFYKKEFEKAKEYYETSVQLYKVVGELSGVGLNLFGLGRVYKAEKDYENAILLFSKALQNFQEVDARLQTLQTYEEIYATYKLIGKFEQALEYHELFVQLQDSLFNENSSRQIKEVETKFQVENQRKQISLLEIERKKEEKYLYILAGFACVILILLIFLYQRFVQRKKLNIVLQQKNEKIAQQNTELIASEKELKELIATKDKFFSIISHDIRGPLNSLTGFLQVLIKHTHAFTQEEIVSFATKLDMSVTNLKNLLENLLEWARSQTGSIDFVPEKVILQDVLEETYSLLHDTAKNKLIGLHTVVEGSSDALADKNMMQFVLRNIISNAIKFTPKGGMITTTIKEKPDNIEINISDTGVGMNDEALEKLFRLDISFSQKGTDNEAGSGLGLILCKEFVEKNNGQISVNSVLEQGTTFTVTIPKF